MRPVSFGNPRISPQSAFEKWAMQAFSEVSIASQQERVVSILEAYSATNYTVTRELDASTAGASDVADFVATLVNDLKAGLIE